jgi:hypothetical protein
MDASRQFDGNEQINVQDYDADGSWCQPKPPLRCGESFFAASEACERHPQKNPTADSHPPDI